MIIMKTIRIMYLGIFLMVFPMLHAQEEVEKDNKITEAIDIPDVRMRLGSPEGAIDMYYDAETLAVKAIVGERKKKSIVIEDAEGNQYVQNDKQWFQMNIQNILGNRESWMKSTYDNFPKHFPYGATFHRIAEFTQITPKMLQENGFNRISAIGANAVFEHATLGMYQFDSQNRLVSIRQQPHASITYTYGPQEVIVPEPDVKLKMRFPGMFSKKRVKKKNREKSRS